MRYNGNFEKYGNGCEVLRLINFICILSLQNSKIFAFFLLKNEESDRKKTKANENLIFGRPGNALKRVELKI